MAKFTRIPVDFPGGTPSHAPPTAPCSQPMRCPPGGVLLPPRATNGSPQQVLLPSVRHTSQRQLRSGLVLIGSRVCALGRKMPIPGAGTPSSAFPAHGKRPITLYLLRPALHLLGTAAPGGRAVAPGAPQIVLLVPHRCTLAPCHFHAKIDYFCNARNLVLCIPGRYLPSKII